MANVRYQVKTSIYMPLDGQWGLVGPGTVFDDAAAVGYSAPHVNILSPGEPAAASLGSHNRATSVRNVNRQ